MINFSSLNSPPTFVQIFSAIGLIASANALRLATSSGSRIHWVDFSENIATTILRRKPPIIPTSAIVDFAVVGSNQLDSYGARIKFWRNFI